MKKYLLLLLMLPLIALSSRAASLKPGIWHGAIVNDSGKEVPFLFDVKNVSGKTLIEIINGKEHLKVDEIAAGGDSVFIKMPFFDSEFRVLLKDEGKLQGYWIRHSVTGESKMPFHAEYGNAERFSKGTPSDRNISGTYKINYPGKEKYSVAEFNQTSDGRLTGSVLNVDGDYRFLEGRVKNDSLYLSTFDGSHCYLFTSKLKASGDSLSGGKFYMGKSGVRDWSAAKDAHAALPDAYSLTSMKTDSETLGFRFKDLQGKVMSGNDAYFKNKVVIIQFMGSWCPNCMDETAFLSSFYKTHKDKVAIVGLAYENSIDFERSRHLLQSFVKRFDVRYPVLVSGFTNKPEQVMVSMPALKNFFAFPTIVILDRNGKVRKIHTGFSGPGTGKYYKDFEEEFSSLIQQLSNEPLSKQ